jgi:DNA-binding GntR family transcriptional regulator
MAIAVTSKRSEGRATSAEKTPSVEFTEHGLSCSDVVAQEITDRVLTGRCVPGQRLIEADLSRDLKVGRGTIREALKRLAAERVIALIPHRGAVVRALTRDEAIELQDVVLALYGLAASLAASRIEHDGNRKRLTAAFERIIADGPQSDRILHALDRSSLYDVIFTIAGNRELMRANPTVLIQILRIQIHPFLAPDDRAKLFADYRQLYDALIRGNAAKARRAMEKHIHLRRAQIERLPPEAFAGESEYRAT